MAQTATTGNLESASKIIIAAARYTEEHNAPAMALIESFSLPSGAKQVTVPKVGQMTISDLTDGMDITDEEEIGMTTVDLTASEVGDVHSLYGALNGGVTLGGNSSKDLSLANLHGCIAHAKANKFGNQVYILHHPNAIANLSGQVATIASSSSGGEISNGWSADLLRNFYSGIRPLNNVEIFEDGNLSILEGSGDDAVGVIADKSAMAVLNSVETRTERQRDASMRATEIVITSDYGVFELDDTKGAAMTYTASAPSTSA